jgi:hypothetical protein
MFLQASTMTELERLGGAFDHSADSSGGSAAAKLVRSLDAPNRRHLGSTDTFQSLMALSSKSGKEGVACQSQRCPRLYSRAARREAGKEGGISLLAVQIRGANTADSASSAFKAVEWARGSTEGWRVVLTTDKELSGAAGSAYAMASARALQANSPGNGAAATTGITMSPTVFMMLAVLLVFGLAVVGMVSCAAQIQTPTRFATQPLRSGKTF